MLRRHLTAFGLALMVADAVSAILVFVVVAAIRFGDPDWLASWSQAGTDGRVLAATYGVGWVLALWATGMYRPRVRWTLRGEVVGILRAVALLAVSLLALLFWFHLPNVSRQFLVLLFPAQFGVSLASRMILREVVTRIRASGHNGRFMLMVGTSPDAARFVDAIGARPELGLKVVGYIAAPVDSGIAAGNGTLGNGKHHEAAVGPPILGTVDEIESILHSHVIDEVAICLSANQRSLVEPIARLCEEEGKIVHIPVYGRQLNLPGATIEAFDDFQVTSLVYGPDRALSLVAKRVFDVAAAALALVVLSPLLLAISVWLRIREGAPVLFRQTRVGLHGRPFEMLKYRTMEPDAELRLDDIGELNEIEGHAFKITNDPRISKSGRTLRRLSLDELPQLWNVVRGEMSIVGPRPPLPSEVSGYDIWHRRRLSMKPGITGLWQVGGRREADFDRWVRMDLEYIERWSLWLDLKIIARTIPAVLTQQGR